MLNDIALLIDQLWMWLISSCRYMPKLFCVEAYHQHTWPACHYWITALVRYCQQMHYLEQLVGQIHSQSNIQSVWYHSLQLHSAIDIISGERQLLNTSISSVDLILFLIYLNTALNMVIFPVDKQLRKCCLMWSCLKLRLSRCNPLANAVAKAMVKRPQSFVPFWTWQSTNWREMWRAGMAKTAAIWCLVVELTVGY